MLKRLWNEDEGVLTFEWILLLTLLVIGVIGGVAGIRDAILHESQGTVGAMVSLDQNFFVTAPLAMGVKPVSGVADSACTSSAGYSAFGNTDDHFDSAFYGTARLLTPSQVGSYKQVDGTGSSVCPLP